MEEKIIKSFICRVKKESCINKFLKEDIIYKLISCFNEKCNKKNYTKLIKDPLNIVLEFYRNYNDKYYQMIIDGIENGKIIINENNIKSFVNMKNNNAFIKLAGNDSDIFMLVHEFAHYIDGNLKPNIIPNQYHFLCEVFSFYIEKKLEIWLDNKMFHELIDTRRNNRIYFETKMLKSIEYELFCEKLYNKTGQIKKEDLDIKKIKSIQCYDYDLNTGLINYLLRYPLANILSDYLIYNQMVINDNDIYKVRLNTNLYEIILNYNESKKLYKCFK